jgi:hypothetical protein
MCSMIVLSILMSYLSDFNLALFPMFQSYFSKSWQFGLYQKVKKKSRYLCWFLNVTIVISPVPTHLFFHVLLHG